MCCFGAIVATVIFSLKSIVSRLKLYHDIQRKVIKDGIDQCREAMRRMTDYRERRRYRKEMTKEEQKQFRSVALEARDARLDLVVPQAETLLREAISTLLDEFRAADEFDVGDDEVSDDSGQSSDLSTQMQTQDLVAVDSSQPDTHFDEGEAASLPPFDPHMHATTVRRNSASKRKSKSRTDENGSRRRRRRRQKVGESGNALREGDINVVDIHDSEPNASRKRKRRRDGNKNSFRPPESDKSDHSDVSIRSDGEASMSFETAENPAARRQRRRARDHGREIRGTTSHFSSTSTSERGVNRVPVAERMQAFLDANSSNLDDFDGFSHTSDGSLEESDRHRKRRPRKRRAQRSSTSRPQREPGMNMSEGPSASFSEDESPIQQGDEDALCVPTRSLSDSLYARLPRNRRTPVTMVDPHTRAATSLSDSCQIILNIYSDLSIDCDGIFDSILLRFKEQPLVVHSEAAEVFNFVLQLLQRNGSMILQAVVLTRTNTLRRHIKLLSFVLDLLACRVNAKLVRDDGLAFEVFGGDNWKAFLEMIILQIMDVIYARIQPSSWGLDKVVYPSIIERLIPLRDAAARLVPLVETVSMCTLDKFVCQRWQQLDGSSNAFVTAIDPQEYKSLLSSGSASVPESTSGNVCV